jgi:hypothetical protein
MAQHNVADGKFGMSRRHDLADGAAHHGLADPDRPGVGFRSAHAAAHVGIERKIAGEDQHLAVDRLRHRALHQFEIVEARRALGPALEQDLAVHAGSHWGLLLSQTSLAASGCDE